MQCRNVLFTAILGLSLSQFAHAQLIPAPTPIADPADTRFTGVKEDWNTPSLATSSLRPVPPLAAYINDNGTYTSELLQVQWRWGDPLDLYVIRPKTSGKPPVVLYMYGYPSDTDHFKDANFQKSVTREGVAAVGFVSALTGHRYHDRPMKEWFISDLQECLAVTAHDVQMVLDYLATRGDLDMSRVGMFAQGSGASIAILASAADSRIKVLDTIDPWGDWPVWLATSAFVPNEERAQYIKPDFLAKAETLDPADWLPKIRAKRFRLQQVAFNQITPDAAKEKLRAAAPADAKVTIYRTPDEFNTVARDNKDLEWLWHELQSLPGVPEDSGATPQSIRGK